MEATEHRICKKWIRRLCKYTKSSEKSGINAVCRQTKWRVRVICYSKCWFRLGLQHTANVFHHQNTDFIIISCFFREIKKWTNVLLSSLGVMSSKVNTVMYTVTSNKMRKSAVGGQSNYKEKSINSDVWKLNLSYFFKMCDIVLYCCRHDWSHLFEFIVYSLMNCDRWAVKFVTLGFSHKKSHFQSSVEAIC